MPEQTNMPDSLQQAYDWSYTTPYALIPRKPILALIEKSEFEALPEYSTTNPTGAFYGKMWRCDLNVVRRMHGQAAFGHDWLLKIYLPHETQPNMCSTEVYKPLLVKKLKQPTHVGGRGSGADDRS